MTMSGLEDPLPSLIAEFVLQQQASGASNPPSLAELVVRDCLVEEADVVAVFERAPLLS